MKYMFSLQGKYAHAKANICQAYSKGMPVYRKDIPSQHESYSQTTVKKFLAYMKTRRGRPR